MNTLKLVKTKSLIDGTGAAAFPGGQILVKNGLVEDAGPAEKFRQLPDTLENVLCQRSDLIPRPNLLQRHQLAIANQEIDRLIDAHTADPYALMNVRLASTATPSAKTAPTQASLIRRR